VIVDFAASSQLHFPFYAHKQPYQTAMSIHSNPYHYNQMEDVNDMSTEILILIYHLTLYLGRKNSSRNVTPTKDSPPHFSHLAEITGLTPILNSLT